MIKVDTRSVLSTYPAYEILSKTNDNHERLVGIIRYEHDIGAYMFLPFYGFRIFEATLEKIYHQVNELNRSLNTKTEVSLAK